MEESERDDLVEALVEGLATRGAPEAMHLADLMRVERELADALAVIRREIDLIVRSLPPLEPDDAGPPR